MYFSYFICIHLVYYFGVDISCADIQIPFLQYSEGMHLTAYICSVSSPSTFVAQPYGSQLVNLMHELR